MHGVILQTSITRYAARVTPGAPQGTADLEVYMSKMTVE
jgi:hypothetical protein